LPACQWVKLACERQRRDLSKQGKRGFPYRFDEERGSRVCRFIEKLPHIKGPKAGERIQLEPWQCFIITTVYGWLNSGGSREGKRRFRRTYIEVPRGNAKSTLSSGIGLYGLSADGEGGAEVYSAATTRDQARIVFRDAQQMARKVRPFMERLGVDVAAHNINILKSASKFEALSADEGTLDGLNIHLAIVDELHAHKTRKVYDVIETGTGKRDQSLLWCITTAGSDRSGICYEVRTYLTKILQKLADDESFFGIIYTIDDGDSWESEDSWIKANPNWGISVQPDIVAQLAAKAMQMPAAQNNFKTKHLDVWVSADVAWMDMRAWDKCGDPNLKISQFASQPCFIGLDLATKTDIAAKIRIFPKEINGERHYFIFGTYYLPELAISESRNSQYPGWEIQERLIVCPGDTLDFGQVEEDIREDTRLYSVQQIGYDPWQAAELAQRLVSEKAPMVEIRNSVQNFSEPMKQIEALARTTRIHHDGDPILAWMMSNVVAHTDLKENIYPRKDRPENKIDGVVALIIGMNRALVHKGAEKKYQMFFVGR
jgi:phage terminase large subunit-like protein